MIKFEILCAEGAESFICGAKNAHGFDGEELSEIVSSFLDLASDEDIEVGLTVSHKCILARIFDMGRYMFVYPIEMCEESDALSAVEDLREYAVREEIPLVITDIPEECLGDIAVRFSHTVIDREAGGESFRLEARSECALLDGNCPEIEMGEITLSSPEERDVSEMARLNRDKATNEYWGYDYLADIGEVADGYFLDAARQELNMGTSLVLAVREGEGYVGEAILWGFDLSGGAEFAVRILPEYRGRGLGSLAVEALAELCRGIGITRLFGRSDVRNVASLNMMEKTFEQTSVSDGIAYYEREL